MTKKKENLVEEVIKSEEVNYGQNEISYKPNFEDVVKTIKAFYETPVIEFNGKLDELAGPKTAIELVSQVLLHSSDDRFQIIGILESTKLLLNNFFDRINYEKFVKESMQ